MEKGVIATLERILTYLLIGVILMLAMGSLFLFVINQEDWLLGIKLDGFLAGVTLALKGFAGLLLAYLIIRFPRKLTWTGILAIGYVGFFAVNGAMTVQKVSYGRQLVSPIPVCFFLVPVLLLLVRFLNNRYGEKTGGPEGPGTPPI